METTIPPLENCLRGFNLLIQVEGTCELYRERAEISIVTIVASLDVAVTRDDRCFHILLEIIDLYISACHVFYMRGNRLYTLCYIQLICISVSFLSYKQSLWMDI